jgi:hypothetical protein
MMEQHDVLTSAICLAAQSVDNAAARRTLAELEAAGYLVPAPAAEPRARPARPQVVRSQDDHAPARDRLVLDHPAAAAPLSRPETGAPDPALSWLYDGSFRRTLRQNV